MAIFHFSYDSISRVHAKSSMRSCAGKAAYISGVKLQSQSGITYDFSTKKVLHSEVVFPQCVNDKSITIEQLWKQVDREETRKNSRTAEYFDVALPWELSLDQNIEIMRSYCQKISNKLNVCVQYGIHPPDGDRRNIHCHFMFHTRDVVGIENGQIRFGKKLRQWSGDRHTVSENLEYWRRMWAETVNAALRKEGIQVTIDHRSNARRGVQEKPGVHNGPQRTAYNRKIEEQRRPEMAKNENESEFPSVIAATPRKLEHGQVELERKAGVSGLGWYCIYPDGREVFLWEDPKDPVLLEKLKKVSKGEGQAEISEKGLRLLFPLPPKKHSSQKRRGPDRN